MTLCRFSLCRVFDRLSCDPMSFYLMSFDPMAFDPRSVNPFSSTRDKLQIKLDKYTGLHKRRDFNDEGKFFLKILSL